GYDTFCSGHAFLPDGRLLVAGGHDDVTGHFHADFVGVPDASLFDPATNSWTRLPDMNAGRWYPTATTLASGEVLVLSGTVTPGVLDTLPQVLTTAGTWRDLTGAQAAAPLGVDLYPRLFVAPDGRVFKAGPDQDTWFLDTAGTGSWTPGPPSHFGLRTYGSAVMYEPGKILIAGGGDPPTATAEVIDLNEPNPAWHSVSPMAFPRRQHNATLLPDGTVLVTGGSSGPGHSNEATPVLPAELWNPATGTWTTLAAEQIPRLYHSTALLLPDGRVLSAGGGQPGTNHPDAEIFSPPDLAQGQGSRPTIASAPATVAYGEAFAVATPDAARIAQVSLIRLGSVTHAFDENQRYLRLGFTPTPGGLIVTAPAGPNLAPPGHYMLFLLDGDGVPSVAQILRIDPPPTPSAVAPIATAPADPINPVAGGGHDAAAPPTAGDGPEARPGPTETVPAAVDAVLPRIRVPKRIHRGKAHRHHQVPPRRRPMHGPGPTAEPRRRVGTAVTGAIRSRRRATPRPGP
ncbi:MAG TPA: galactose oxidase-like domain-containing protein, partial [Isosphaeraceae bacterium]